MRFNKLSMSVGVLALMNNCKATDINIKLDDAGIQQTAMDVQQRIPTFINENQDDLMAIAASANAVASEFANRFTAAQGERNKLVL